ncbi:MAG: hypothetical protein CL862_04100 [Cyanobium sp. NAT70]|nr:hypothetical protein [Cyanobium sp. NAT70]
MKQSAHQGLIHQGLKLLLCFSGLTMTLDAAKAASVQDLLQTLKRHGFTVVQAHPRNRKAYGQFIPDQKQLIISPLTHQLGIARHVLLHEAVHAAQSCPNGTLRPLNLNRSTSPVVESRIRYLLNNHYDSRQQILEQEAFRLQSQPDAEALIIEALNDRCQVPGG